ncbi:MAG TPA: hypothetical protein VF030_07870 [Solirubrobacterales bacterium]
MRRAANEDQFDDISGVTQRPELMSAAAWLAGFEATAARARSHAKNGCRLLFRDEIERMLRCLNYALKDSEPPAPERRSGTDRRRR